MNTKQQTNHELAKKLKSLSFEPQLNNSAPTDGRSNNTTAHKGSRHILYSTVLIVTAISAVAWLNMPNILELAESLTESIEPEITAVESVEHQDVATTSEQQVSYSQIAKNQEIAGSGYIIAPTYTDVFSQHDGRISNIAVEIGDPVTAGDVLLSMDNKAAGIALEEATLAKNIATLALRIASKDLESTREKFTRSKKLFAKKVISKQAFADIKAVFENKPSLVALAKLDIAAADIKIRKAQQHMDELIVRAPISGIVAQLNVRLGDSVPTAADSMRSNKSLFTIIDMSDLAIQADIGETNIAKIQPGMRGEAVLDGFPAQPFEVVVDHISPVISKEKGTISVRLLPTAPPKGIRPNMAVRINLKTSNQPRIKLEPNFN